MTNILGLTGNRHTHMKLFIIRLSKSKPNKPQKNLKDPCKNVKEIGFIFFTFTDFGLKNSFWAIFLLNLLPKNDQKWRFKAKIRTTLTIKDINKLEHFLAILCLFSCFHSFHFPMTKTCHLHIFQTPRAHSMYKYVPTPPR